MATALIATVGLVLVALINTASALLGARNERALTHQEVDLLAKLDPQSNAARELNEVIGARIARWHAKAFKTSKDKESGGTKAVERSSWADGAVLANIFAATGLLALLLLSSTRTWRHCDSIYW